MIRPDRTRLGDETPLPWHYKAALAAEVLVTYVRVRWLMRRLPIEAVATRLRPRVSRYSEGPAATLRAGHRLARAVTRVLEPGPWDSRCLMRSLVLLHMLAKRGIAGTLLIGVYSGEAFAAHAWVEHDREPLLPRLGFDPLKAL
jgi:hypothetical protein